jgi:AcrR family transcriptional regulator
VTTSTQTPDRIVAAMGQLMRHQGYGATSLKHIVDAASAPIGSVYHFFPQGKRQVAADALRSTAAAYIALVPLVMDPHADLGDALRAFFLAAADDIESAGWATMCPVVMVGAEVADREPELRSVCASIVGGWIDQGSAYFVGRGVAPAEARLLTLTALSALEGAFSIARITRSAEALRVAGDVVAELAASLQSRLGPA